MSRVYVEAPTNSPPRFLLWCVGSQMSHLAKELVHNIPRQKFAVCPERRWWDETMVERDKISDFHHVKLNTKRWLNVIAVDIDDRNSALTCYDTDKSIQPNLLVQNPANGHGHALYFLSEPLYLGSHQVTQFAKDVRRRLSLSIPGADQRYNHLWAKTPLHDSWRIFPYNKSLIDLRAIVKSPWLVQMPFEQSMPVVTTEATFEQGRRHMDLFDVLRKWAYQSVGKFERRDWHEEVLARAEKINETINSPLPISEVHSIAKSVAVWTQKHYHGKSLRVRSPWNSGVMGLSGQGLTRDEAMSLAALRTNQVRVEKSRSVIRNALALSPGASQSEIARVTGLSRVTVGKYWRISPVSSSAPYQLP